MVAASTVAERNFDRKNIWAPTPHAHSPILSGPLHQSVGLAIYYKFLEMHEEWASNLPAWLTGVRHF
jgi:hypothetical protein